MAASVSWHEDGVEGLSIKNRQEEERPQQQQIRLFSSTPATSLTRGLPHGFGADVLVLASDAYDLRDILYTAYAERGLPARQRGKEKGSESGIDVTLVRGCGDDADEEVAAALVARDMLFLTLVVDAGEEGGGSGSGGVGDDSLWEIYHGLFIGDKELRLISSQAEKLLSLTDTGSLQAWNHGEYGRILRFYDERSLNLVRKVWDGYRASTHATEGEAANNAAREKLSESIRRSREALESASADIERELSVSGLRSAAPVPLASTYVVRQAYKQFWDHGSLSYAKKGDENAAGKNDTLSRRFANPMLAACLCSPTANPGNDKVKIIHYATNPLLGFQLGTTLAKLAPGSPFSVDDESVSSENDGYRRIIRAVKVQFAEWMSAFRESARDGRMLLRFCVREPLRLFASLDQTIAQNMASSEESHGTKKQFDVIDTTSLADTYGILNLLVATRPALRPSATSMLYTETLRRCPDLTYKQTFDFLMCGDAISNALLLGLSPVEYWTNASFESCIDDVLIQASYDKSPSELLLNHFRASWRLTDGFCGQLSGISTAEQRFLIPPSEFAQIISRVVEGMLKLEPTRLQSTESPTSNQLLAKRTLKRLVLFVQLVLHNVRTDWGNARKQFLESLSDIRPAVIVPHLEKFRLELDKLSSPKNDNSDAENNDDTWPPKLKGSSTTTITCLPERLDTVTTHFDLEKDEEKTLLASMAPVSIRQSSASTITVTIGSSNDSGTWSREVSFPIPVLASKVKTRIARKSGYIELIAQVLGPLELEDATDLIHPARMTSSLSPTGVPVIMNNHSVNLDSLPIISVDNASEAEKHPNSWLSTLASQQFSKRERKERELAHEDDMVPASAKLNLKESIFTIFMLASGLQGGSTGLFTLSHPTKGNQILIFIRALRIDASVGSVVADAAVLPITRELLDSGELETFLLVLRELEACVIDVSDEELVLWKRILPALVERCRTWDHRPDCEYSSQATNPRSGPTCPPLSVEPERPFLCSCGNGKLPERYMGGLPEWEDIASRHAVRVAISPLFAVPWVEDIMDVDMVRQAGGVDGMVAARDRCRRCGASCRRRDREDGETGHAADPGEDQGRSLPLMRCTRCKDALYCSHECQKKDWKKHRMECRQSD